ncbi:hypothetical protein BC936DRAFT_144923 [Jimgerdemannia flammicorona]|uniref:Uncharacterized protein n=2 Tax=Jimgerdemannia flammicorona TaxID=994334 RepID=A0A433DBB1_9FUNG|nr:hypothetical protein BC936DRAFT_144923 [Jimgerdemannia flammicorona]RUS33872.1 hypothetical protein BC938DRAFT_483423 [Jimgerdemannia flammicorona]
MDNPNSTNDLSNGLSDDTASNAVIAFLLALFAGLGTGIGGLIVRPGSHGVSISIKSDFQSTLGNSQTIFMGRMQGLSAGVMIYLSLFDILPESAAEVGIWLTFIWFCIGMGGMWIMEMLIMPIGHDASSPALVELGASTGNNVGMAPSPAGVHTTSHTSEAKTHHRRMVRTSLVTFIGMALHNILEGLSVYLSTLKDLKFGIPLAIVIMLHNMTEGVAVAIPIYLATRNSRQVLQLTLINGLFEPFGVVVAGFMLQSVLTDALLAELLASVAGVMTFISAHELVPMAMQYAGRTQTFASVVVGFATCFVLLAAVNAVYPR